MTKQTEFA